MKRHPKYRDYFVSMDGRVWSSISKKFLKIGRRGTTGHHGVCLRVRPGVYDSVYVHKLVAEMFLPRVEGKPLALHDNDNVKDNSVWNLHWGDMKDNRREAEENGVKIGWKAKPFMYF